MSDKGFLSLPLLLILGLIVLVASGGAIYNVYQSNSAPSPLPITINPSPSISPSPSPSPSLASKVTVKASVKPSATAKASSAATPTPTASSSTNNSTSASTPTPTPVAQDIKPFCSTNTIPSSGSAPLSVLLSAGGGSGTHGTIAGFQWDTNGDGSWDTDIVGSDRNMTYSSAGTFTFKVRLKTSTGDYSDPCSGSVTVS